MCEKGLKANYFNNLSNDELITLDGGFWTGFGNKAGEDAYDGMKAVVQNMVETGFFIVGHVFGFFEGLLT
ncbi:MAG: hypothetical protein GX271_11250 [Clostridiales bacterium]|jgi:hypothetical protein|nr:hypothetical protein [Clostridiales bacterium]